MKLSCHFKEKQTQKTFRKYDYSSNNLIFSLVEPVLEIKQAFIRLHKTVRSSWGKKSESLCVSSSQRVYSFK